MKKIKAIETRYNGYRFRSRLEARWAVFFDSLGMVWEYEPEGFILPGAEGKYLPDFKVFSPGHEDYYWLEIKGERPTQREMDKLAALSIADDHWCYVASHTLGVPKLKNAVTGNRQIVEGSWIVGFVAPSAVHNSSHEAAQRHEEQFLCGFYEDPQGIIHLGHLYNEDLPIIEPAATRAVESVLTDYSRMDGINFGSGRSYRGERIKGAYDAARSARFEHGETGRTR